MDGSDPRVAVGVVSKPRLPKPYTEEQLVFLKSHISGFETRTRGHVRGDAKKFALDRASEFLARFGLPPDLQGVEEAEPRFREQIYNWYKNTVGRARRKLEGRSRSKKVSDKASSSSETGLRWTSSLATSNTLSYAPADSSDEPSASTSTLQTRSQPPTPAPTQPQAGPSTQAQTAQAQTPQQLQFIFQSTLPVTSASTLALNVTPTALRDAFLTPAIDAATLSSLIQSYVLAHPSPTPLGTVVGSLFDATASGAGRGGGGGGGTGEVYGLLRRYIDACAFFPGSLVHADMSGSMAGQRALQMALRKASVWAPFSSSPPTTTGGGGGQGSLSDEMERIAADRQRRKEYVLWAQIHAAAIELGMLSVSDGSLVTRSGSSGTSPSPTATTATAMVGMGVGVNGGSSYSAYGVNVGISPPQSQSPHHLHAQHPHGHGHGPAHTNTPVHTQVSPSTNIPLSFSESMVRDAVWEPDEVEWVAGIIVLRALIRSCARGVGVGATTTTTPTSTSTTGGLGWKKTEYEQLLGAYERRWKEIRDEARQAIVTEVLIGAREELARMDEGRGTTT